MSKRDHIHSSKAVLSHSSRFAAIDLGSNSFQLLLLEYRPESEQLWHKLLYRKERAQLAAGMDKQGNLNQATIQQALNYITEFKQLLQPFSPYQLRIVGTKALREANNASDFLAQASDILNHPVEVISGIEEAGLIYLGASLNIQNNENKLIIDVGGGSTEFSFGKSIEPQLLESLNLGCVSFQQQFFAEGIINRAALTEAENQAIKELLPLKQKLDVFNWQVAIGCSGVFEALLEVQKTLIPEQTLLTLEGLETIQAKILIFSNSAEIKLATLGTNRKKILPAALSIVIAIFRTLDITQMKLSKAALKDGVIYSLQRNSQLTKS